MMTEWAGYEFHYGFENIVEKHFQVLLTCICCDLN